LPAPTLASTRIGFGSGSNLLTSSENFAFEDDRIISIKNGGTSKIEVARFISSNNYGVYVTGGNLELQVISGGNIFSKSNHNFEGRILLNNAAGTAGQVLTSQGSGANPTWTTVSGGSVGTIDQVLAAGNTAFDKNLVIKNGALFFTSQNNQSIGNLAGVSKLDGSAESIRLTAAANVSMEFYAGILNLVSASINIGPTSTSLVNISGTPFKLAYSDFWAGTYTPALGDKVLFSYDSDKNAFVMQKVQVYTSPIDSKNYLVI
jgi:hypothetical protein